MTGEDGKDKESDAKSSDRLPLLGALDQRWRNWWIRGILSIVMISLFAVVIYLGPIALSLLVVGLLLKCFQEIIAIGYSKYREHNLPLYRVLNWYIAIVASMFIYCDNFFYYYPELKGTTGLFSFFGQYHRIICLSLYVAGFVLFVLTLQKDLYNTQFSMVTAHLPHLDSCPSLCLSSRGPTSPCSSLASPPTLVSRTPLRASSGSLFLSVWWSVMTSWPISLVSFWDEHLSSSSPQRRLGKALSVQSLPLCSLD
jgi:hypothetical protein